MVTIPVAMTMPGGGFALLGGLVGLAAGAVAAIAVAKHSPESVLREIFKSGH